MSNKETDSLLDWDATDETSEADAEFEKDFNKAADVPKACSIDNPDCDACQ